MATWSGQLIGLRTVDGEVGCRPMAAGVYPKCDFNTIGRAEEGRQLISAIVGAASRCWGSNNLSGQPDWHQRRLAVHRLGNVFSGVFNNS
jgi:hypothetical protein